MEYFWIISLIISIAALAGFVLVGYYLYANVQNRARLAELFANKESEILELYSSLEKMIEAIDNYLYEARLEFEEREKSLAAEAGKLAALMAAHNPDNAGGDGNRPEEIESAVISEYEKCQKLREKKSQIQTERDRLIEKFAEMRKEQSPARARENAVMKMYNEGADITQIAKELSLGSGEVELIIKLKSREKKRV